jgi:hypothetical protein
MNTPTEISPLPSRSSEAGSGTGDNGSATATPPNRARDVGMGLDCIMGTGPGLACAISTGVAEVLLALTGEVSLESLPIATKATITTMSPIFFIPPSRALPRVPLGFVSRPRPPRRDTAGIAAGDIQLWAIVIPSRLSNGGRDILMLQ